MSKFKVWIEIEEIDESQDFWETVDRSEAGEVAGFDTLAEAQELADKMWRWAREDRNGTKDT
jgi:hypothetical protein